MSRNRELICDKCGKSIEGKGVLLTNKDVKNLSSKIEFYDVGVYRAPQLATRLDLCQECTAKFVNWLECDEDE